MLMTTIPRYLSFAGSVILLPFLAIIGRSNTFTFSYDFSLTPGYHSIVSGTFDGTRNGEYVDGLSNLTVFFAGVRMPNEVCAVNTDDASPAIVSFDENLNNFVFSNWDPRTESRSSSYWYFEQAPGSGNADSWAEADYGLLASLGLSSAMPGAYWDSKQLLPTWTLTEATAVPDTGASALLLILGLAALGLTAGTTGSFARRPLRNR